jgi:uncharacterized protein
MPRLCSVATDSFVLILAVCGFAMRTGEEASSVMFRGWQPQQAPIATRPTTQPATQPAKPREKLAIGGEEFELEIAADDATRARGLMHRDKIDEHGGMLFIYPETQDELGFWMKNCPIDIDILYLDAKGRIVATYTMKAEPTKRDSETETQYEDRLKRYPSRRPAQFAIELKAGTIERLKIEPGQMIEVDVKRLKAMAE